MDTSSCPVCRATMDRFDQALVMSRYDATYSRCPACGLVAIREVPWLPEAYESAIHDADVGLLRRARRSSALTSAVIRFEGVSGGRFLDWAAGYGVFTQVMRDKGHDFWQHDDFATPVFAGGFRDDGVSRCDLATAFEVVEHLHDPREQLAGLAERTDLLLFTTETLPEPAPPVADWWYYMPEVGQHITFHTPTSLRLLGWHLGYDLTTNGRNWHLFHRRPVDPRTRAVLSSRLNRAARGLRSGLQQVSARVRPARR